MRALVSIALVSIAAGCTCGPQPSGAAREIGSPAARSGSEQEEAPRFEEVAGGLAWHAEPPLVARRPSGEMRAAEYAVRGHPGAELAVFHFGPGEGGSIDDNVRRWLEQIEQPDGRPTREVATIARGEEGGVAVTTVDARGTFSGMRGAAAGARHAGWRLLGAIAEGPDGPVFFKLTGPEDAVGEAEGAFRALVESIRRAD